MMVAERPALLTARECGEVWTNAGRVLNHEYLFHRV